MKLKNFLSESSISSLDFSEFFNNVVGFNEQGLKTLIGDFKGLGQLKHVSINENSIKLEFSNSFVDTTLDFTNDVDLKDTEKKNIILIVSTTVNKSLIFKKSDPDDALMSNARSQSAILHFENSKRYEKIIENTNKIVSEFTEWYFELTSQYGEVKLIKTPYMLDGNFSDGKRRWVPYLGFYLSSPDEITKVVA